MYKIFLIVLILTITSSAFAINQNTVAISNTSTLPASDTNSVSSAIKETPVSVTNQNANINKGNMEVGGSGTLGYSTVGGFLTYLTPTLKYFFIDKLAIGGSLVSEIWSSQVLFRLGPSASYYFWSNKNWADYVGAEVLYSLNRRTGSYDDTNESSTWAADARVGANYFITREVAFGPALIYTRYFDFVRYSDRSYDYTSWGVQILANFSVYL
jgi:hypothetical protein